MQVGVLASGVLWVSEDKFDSELCSTDWFACGFHSSLGYEMCSANSALKSPLDRSSCLRATVFCIFPPYEQGLDARQTGGGDFDRLAGTAAVLRMGESQTDRFLAAGSRIELEFTRHCIQRWFHAH